MLPTQLAGHVSASAQSTARRQAQDIIYALMTSSRSHTQVGIGRGRPRGWLETCLENNPYARQESVRGRKVRTACRHGAHRLHSIQQVSKLKKLSIARAKYNKRRSCQSRLTECLL